MRRATLGMLAGMVTCLAPSLGAQLCRGLPARHGFAAASVAENQTRTIEIGVATSRMGGLTVNAAQPKAVNNGSKLVSWGGRAYYGPVRGAWHVCALTGVQVGYGHLVNAEGIRYNAQLSSRTLLFGMGFARAMRITPGVGAFAYVVPQYDMRFDDIVLYSRADTVSASETRSGQAFTYGAGLQVGPLLARASSSRTSDVPWSWTLTVG